MAVPVRQPGDGGAVQQFSRQASVQFGGTIRLAHPDPPFAWVFNAAALGCTWGHVVPELVKAWDIPGLNGNGRAAEFAAGWVSRLVREGGREIPVSFPVTAWGRSYDERRPAPGANFLARFDVEVPGGASAVHWTEAWTRPIRIGTMVEWEWDQRGRLEFLVRVLEWGCPDGLVRAQIERAVRPRVERIRPLLRDPEKRSRRQALDLAAHLPAAHTPADLRGLREEAWAEAVEMGIAVVLEQPAAPGATNDMPARPAEGDR